MVGWWVKKSESDDTQVEIEFLAHVVALGNLPVVNELKVLVFKSAPHVATSTSGSFGAEPTTTTHTNFLTKNVRVSRKSRCID